MAQRFASQFLGLALAAGSLAQTGAAGATDGDSQALDFELSDGHAFVRLADLPKRVTVVNFWRSDCPPCVREMPLLADTARQGKSQVVAIALQRPYETANAQGSVLAALQAPVQLLHGPSEPRGLLARFGNPHGALPHTVLLDPERHPCGQHTGELSGGLTVYDEKVLAELTLYGLPMLKVNMPTQTSVVPGGASVFTTTPPVAIAGPSGATAWEQNLTFTYTPHTISDPVRNGTYYTVNGEEGVLSTGNRPILPQTTVNFSSATEIARGVLMEGGSLLPIASSLTR